MFLLLMVAGRNHATFLNRSVLSVRAKGNAGQPLPAWNIQMESD